MDQTAETAAKPAYKRILLKLSGEALMGEDSFGINRTVLARMVEEIKSVVELGVQVGIVVGGGNIFRGVALGATGMDRATGDYMGMLATVMNCLAVSDVMEQKGIPVRVQTAVEMSTFAEHYTWERAVAHLEEGKVVLFGAGSGCPYFSTDTAAVLRAAEIGADAILLAKNIDGVYSADPHVDPSAVKYDAITYDEVLAKHLAVMDLTATSLAMENDIPVVVFALADPQNIVRAVMGEPVGTVVTK